MPLNSQISMWERPVLPSDIVYTPKHISNHIIKCLLPTGTLLDPCRGDGSFFDNFPKNQFNSYCEIREGSDFFDFTKKVDWVIGNPPYSIFLEFLKHAFNISNNVSFLVPTNKVFQRQVIMDLINEWGGIKSQIIYGSGTLIGFPFGFSVGNFHFQKGYKGPCEIILGMKEITKQL